MTRPDAETAARILNKNAKPGFDYQVSYAGKGWRVERWRDGIFEGIELK